MYIFREREREREYNLQQQKPKLRIFSIKTHFWNYPKHVVFLGFTKHLVLIANGLHTQIKYRKCCAFQS
jgi:hypothetical protein